MMRIPGMLLIGAFQRNAGKTTLSCNIIRKLSVKWPIAAVKTTIIRDNESVLEPDGFILTEEKGQFPDKDTGRLKQAGANPVFWLRAREDTIHTGMKKVLNELSPGTPLICEGNAVRRKIRPDLFIMVRNPVAKDQKPSARSVCAKADLIVETPEGHSSLMENCLCFHNGCWHLCHDLFHRDGIILPRMESLPCRSD